MIYILNDIRTHNFKPEIEYGMGITLPFKKGYFLYDTDKEDKQYSQSWIRGDGNIIIEGTAFNIKKNLTFDNPKKAEIIFLLLKIDELKESSFDFFMPLSFKKYVTKFNTLKAIYPEYII